MLISDTATVAQEVLHTRLLMIERNVIYSLTSLSLLAPIVAWYNWDTLQHIWLLAWVGCVWAALAWRWAYARRTLAQPPPIAQASLMLSNLIWRAVPGGLLLALSNYLFFTPDDPQILLLLVVVQVLVFAAQVGAAAPPLAVMAVLLGPGYLTLLVLCLADGQPVTRYLALVLVLFAVALVRIARNLGNTLDKQTALVIENRVLAAERDVLWHKAESASLSKSHLFAAAGHDLRAPAHALQLFLSRFDDAALSGHNRELIEPVRACSTALLSMLDGVQDYSRTEVVDLAVDLDLVALQTVFEALERDFGQQAESKGLAFRCVATRQTVQADAHLLDRALHNLVANALNYTACGGVLVGTRRRGDQVWVEVWDTGRGLSVDDIELVFTAFKRGPSARTDAPMGLGLGLTIVQRFCSAMGATVSVNSRLGRGSVFRLSLPVAQCQLPATVQY